MQDLRRAVVMLYITLHKWHLKMAQAVWLGFVMSVVLNCLLQLLEAICCTHLRSEQRNGAQRNLGKLITTAMKPTTRTAPIFQSQVAISAKLQQRWDWGKNPELSLLCNNSRRTAAKKKKLLRRGKDTFWEF